MSNSYESDPVKAKARHEIYKATLKYLPRNIGNGTALFLPSTNGLEMQLLERRGFRRDRMIALEGDPQKIEAVRQANPGIVVVPTMTHDFFANKWEEYKDFFPLTYCGLDYECQLNKKVMGDLAHMAENQLLIDGGMIYTNVYGMRENEEMKLNYSNSLMSSEIFRNEVFQNPLYHQLSEEAEFRFKENKDRQALIERIRLECTDKEECISEYMAIKERIRDEVFKPHEEEINKILLHFSEKNLKLSRNKAISGWVRISLETRDYEKFNIVDIKFDDIIAEVCQRNYFHDNGEQPLSEIQRNLGFCGNPKQFRLFYSDLIEISNQIKEKKLNKEKEWYDQGSILLNKFSRDYFKKAELDELLKLLDSEWIGGYTESESCRFQYTSNKNSNMMLDIVKVAKLSPFIDQTLQKVLNSDWTLFYGINRPYLIRERMIPNEYFNKCPEIDLLKKETSKFKKWLSKELGDRLNKYWKNVEKFRSIEPSRIHLGSAYRPLLRSERTAGEFVIEGKSDDEIALQYTFGKNMQRKINALRACKTQGGLKIPKNISEKQIKEDHQELKGKEYHYFLKPKIFNHLPRMHQKALEFFVDEAVASLSKTKQERIEKAFHASNFEEYIRQPIEDIRLYAFFDDLRADILKNRQITSDTINAHYRSVRDTLSLIEAVPFKPNRVKDIKLAPLSELVKEEIRQLRREKFEVEDIWNHLQGKGVQLTKQQCAAIAAWGHPNLAKMKKPRIDS